MKPGLKIVGEALARIKIGVLARKYGVNSETVRNWVRQDTEEKYHKATKLLSEKELEIEVLRELLKKRTRITRKIGPWKKNFITIEERDAVITALIELKLIEKHIEWI
ncbi:MAG TPA: hypothetical protein VIL22_01790 [Paenibacillaceae bacterium]